MPLFRGSVSSLRALADSGEIVDVLSEQFRFQLQQRPSLAEQRSWKRSLDVLSNDLIDAGLADLEVLVEYQLPLTSKRADVVLCGAHPSTGELSYLVVELKQWSAAKMLDGTDDVVVVDGGERLHPVAQVDGYTRYLHDFVASLDDDATKVAGVAYLHNATDRDLGDLWAHPHVTEGRMFTGQRRGEWLQHLQSSLAADGGVAADQLLGSAVRPSKHLLKVAAAEVQQREQFVLLDEQQVAYSLVMRAVEQAMRANAKEVIVVTGGPGSGKSVIALSLLGELARQGRTAMHATGSSAFTKTLRKVAGKQNKRVQELFKYFNSYMAAEPNAIDVLICDEAHRIRRTSANRYTSAALRSDRPQVDELIDAARVPVFLLDEHQVVRPGEIGTLADIRAAAERKHLSVRHIDLDGQFRLGGSRAYEHWVLRLLGLEPGGPTTWEGDDRFDVSVQSRPSAIEDALRERLADGYNARIAAGYAWRWSNAKDGSLPNDVVIGDWQRPWNNKKDTKVGDAPGTPFWASDPAGFDQVGCVYTAQGFEYDYAGVIIADDLVWREDRWVARAEYSHDSQVKKAEPEQFARAVLNTYKVLLTRGMRGVSIYSTDAETQAMLERLVVPR